MWNPDRQFCAVVIDGDANDPARTAFGVKRFRIGTPSVCTKREKIPALGAISESVFHTEELESPKSRNHAECASSSVTASCPVHKPITPDPNQGCHGAEHQRHRRGEVEEAALHRV